MGRILKDWKDGCWLFGVVSGRLARASPALLSVLWASLARAPLRCAKGALVSSCLGLLLPWPPAALASCCPGLLLKWGMKGF